MIMTANEDDQLATVSTKTGPTSKIVLIGLVSLFVFAQSVWLGPNIPSSTSSISFTMTPTAPRPISNTTLKRARCHSNDQIFTWMEDIGRGLAKRHSKKIPPVLYQTAKDRCVPTSIYNATVRAWLESPSYSLDYQFYDDARMDTYLFDRRWASIFPGLTLALQCIEHVQQPVMKTDIWRYIILWEKGGIFADLDVGLDTEQSLLQHLRDTDDDGVFVIVTNQAGKQRVLSQWLLAVTPNHPLMFYAAQHAITRVVNAKRAIPIQHTGPRAIYDATDQFLKGQGGSAVSRYLEVDHVYTERLDFASSDNSSSSSSSINRNTTTRRPYSFRVVPASWAKNLAFPKEKAQAYQLMNMTHYMDKQKGQGGGKKAYDEGKTCLEFLGGSFLDEDQHQAFKYNGTIHYFQNTIP